MLPYPAKLVTLALGLLCLLAACTPRQGAGPAAELPRAAPGYLQWLERQSMLGAAPELTAQVSGTELLWRNSGAGHRPQLLLEAAPNWLLLNPHTLAAGQPLFRALNTSPLTADMAQMGFQGLFIAPTGERGDIWNKHFQSDPNGENVVSLRFDAALGAEADFNSLARRLEERNIQLGGELPPAATGLGPDFILQARHASRFSGIYAMLPVPRKDWPLLPALPEEWECLPLRPEAEAALVNSGLLPPALNRDALPWATPGGWAATGEVRGADGQPRRWVYRYSGHYLRPVLLWQDPSGRTRRIFSAAIIQHVGLQRQSLTGLRMESLLGLDAAAPANSASAGGPVGLSPGLEALDEAAREVHRYGGWAMQDDVLPPSLTPAIQAGPVDFTREAAVPAGAALALLTQDAAPLAALLRAAQAADVDQSRLARGLHQWQGMDWRPLLDLPHGRELAARAQQAAGAADGLRLAASPASLAALALGLDTAAAQRPEHAATLRQTCLLLLSWRLGLPGLAFISPQDVTGALWLDLRATDSPQGLTPLWENRQSLSPAAAPPLPLAFGPLATQWKDKTSFLHHTARLLQARQKSGLAQGRLSHIVEGPSGCLAVFSALPSGGWWLLAANFSAQPQILSCALPGRASGAQDILHGQSSPELADNGRSLRLRLAPRQARHILLDTSSHTKTQGATP